VLPITGLWPAKPQLVAMLIRSPYVLPMTSQGSAISLLVAILVDVSHRLVSL